MAHDPIQFHGGEGQSGRPRRETSVKPRHLDLKKDRALTVHWSDGRVSIYPIAYLRKMSPSAETRCGRRWPATR